MKPKHLNALTFFPVKMSGLFLNIYNSENWSDIGQRPPNSLVYKVKIP